MKCRILALILGLAAILLLASATLAKAPETTGSEGQRMPQPSNSLGSFEEPAPAAPAPSSRSQPIADRAVEEPPPPSTQRGRPSEPPPPPVRREEPEFLREAGPPPPQLPPDPLFLRGMAPYPVPPLRLTEVGILQVTTVITVNETYDYVRGYHEYTDDTLLLRLYDGATLKGFGVARTDGVGYFYGEFFDEGSQVQIDPGDTVKVGTGVTTDTIQVVQITGSADPLNDDVTGVITGTGLSLPVSVTVSFPWAAVNQTVSTNGTGDFTADFTGIYDMDAYDPGDVGYEDTEGNWVSARLSPVGFFTVHDTFNEVNGHAAPEASLTITRTPQFGSLESHTTIALGTDGWYSVGFSAIDPSDVIEVDDGASVISTTVVTLTATATPWANDIISGTAPASSDVAVAVWQISPVGRWLWHKKTVTSDLSGDYDANFSGTLNLDRWSSIYVICPDISGNETWFFYGPALASVNETYNNVWGRATPGAVMTATLKDSVGGHKDTGTDTSDSNSGYYEIGFDADVGTGDSVDVTGGGISATIGVTNLTALPDTDADTISGVSPANSDLIVSGWRQDYIAGPGFDEFVTSTGGGTYTDDLSGRYDLYNGYQGHVSYSQVDEHKLFVHYHAPSVRVNQTHDGIWGYVDTASIPVTATLWSSTDIQKDQTVVTSEETDGSFQAWFDGSVDIVPGDKVEVETTSWTNMITVASLSLDFDASTDIISGTAPANSIVLVGVYDNNWRYLAEMLVPTDGAGDFTADFTDELDITGNETLGLGCENEDHNENYIWLLAPYMRVNQTHDWIQGRATLNATVSVTVTRGASTFTANTTADGNGWFHVGNWDFSPSQLDIQVGDTIEMSSDGVYRSLTVMAMTGIPDIDSNTVSGNIAGASDGDRVRIEVWEEGGRGGDTTTNSSGDYSSGLSGWDLKEGHQVAVWYITPDGDECGIVVRYLQIRANITWDWVDGQTAPTATVNVTLTGSGIKGTATTSSNKDGDYSTDVYSDSTPADIILGDWLTATADGREADLFVAGPLTVEVNEETEVISGDAPPNTDLWVDIWGYGWFDAQSDEFGDYSFDADAEGIDLGPGMRVQVGYPTDEGHDISAGVLIPYLRVNQTHDWIQGTASPNATVSLTVTRDATTFTGSTTARSDGWFNINRRDFSPEVDIQVDDLVEMSSDGVYRSLDVVAMTGIPDVDANTISGHIDGASEDDPVRIEVWVEDGGGVDTTTDSSGDYDTDLGGWDLKAGHQLCVWYVTDDGDECGIVATYLQIRADITDDWIDGDTKPSAAVNITLTGSGIKGTAATNSDDEGYYGAGVYTDSTRADVVTGDTIDVTADGREASLYVDVLTVEANADTETISGYAPADTDLQVDVWDYGWFDIHSDQTTGYYSFDAGAEGINIEPGVEGRVRYSTDEGHQISARFGVPFMRVNQTDDWIEGLAAPNATVEFTVTRDATTFTGSSTSGGGGRFNIDGSDFSPQVDIQVYDLVEMSSDGIYRSLEVVAMTGIPDIDADAISGHVDGASDGDGVRIDIWADGGDVETTTDEFGDYDTGLGGWELEAGHAMGVWYITDDGDECGITVAYLHVEVDLRGDWIDGYTEPSATVNVTLTGSGIKGTAVTSADEDGYYGTEIYSGTTEVDIVSGDTIEVTADGRQASVHAVLTVEANADTETISGYAQPDMDLQVDVWDYGWFDTHSDETTGYYSFDAGVEDDIDLQPGMGGQVRYNTDEGHTVRTRFDVPYARVNYTSDGVDGRVTPYATVNVTVTDISGVKGTNSGTARSNGRFSFYAGANVVPGDTVYATSPGLLDATMEVFTITGQIDAATDIVSGTMSGGSFPATGEVEVGRPPDWDLGDSMPIDIDESGNYEADFGGQFDIQLGDEVNVWYHQPDGHQIGISLYTTPLRQLQVHQTHDWVQAEGLPGNTVHFTVTNGLVRGTATAVIQDNGRVWTRIYSGTERVDIDVGDIVEASSEGYLRSAEVLQITGLVDPDANTVAGQIIGAGEYPADLRVDVWVPGVSIGENAQTDGSGNYSVDLSGIYIVQMGDELTVWYHEPDGDQVGSLFSALRLGVSSSNDDFWGQTGPPYVPMTLTLKDGFGSFKDQAFVTADKDGSFQDHFPSEGVEPGDTLEAETSIISDTLYVLPLPTSIDLASDVIEGTCVPNAYINIWISRDEDQADISELPTDGSGDFTADFGAIGWNIQIGDYVDIDCRIPRGHTVHRGFEVEVEEYYNYVPLVMKNFAVSEAAEMQRPVESPTPTMTPVPIPTATSAPTPTSTSTAVPTPTATSLATSTPVATPTPTFALTPTDTATTVPTATPTATPTNTATPVPTPTATAAPTNTPVATPTPTFTPTPTGTPTEVPTATPAEAVSPTPEPCPTPEESETAAPDTT